MSAMQQKQEEWFQILLELCHISDLERKVEAELRKWELKGRDIAHATSMVRDAKARRLLRLSELMQTYLPAGRVEVETVTIEVGAHFQLPSLSAQ